MRVPESLRRLVRSTPLQTAAVAAVAGAYLGWLQFLTPWIVETDGYYHAKVALLTRTQGVLREFPWAAFSLWAERWYDKEFLYHLLLSLFTFGDLAFGAKAAAVCFGTLFFASFFLVLRLGGVRRAWFWTLLLLLGSGGYFGWRVGLTRPHLLSMTLSLWTMHFVVRDAPRRLFAVSAVYALSYTAPHVAVLYGLIAAVAHRVAEKRFAWRAAAAAALGVAAGWCLHPNFPANFEAFKIQIVDVLASSWRLSGPDLHVGGELRPPLALPFLREHLPILAAMAAAAWAWHRLRPRRDAAVLTTGLTAAGFLLLSLLSKRMVEYALPFTLWTCARLLDDAPERWAELVPRAGPSARRWAAAAVAALAVGLCARSMVVHRGKFAAAGPSRNMAAALWLRAEAPDNALVYTCDWDDAPELFFFNHRNRYLVFMDPNYLYRWRPDVWALWDETSNGRGARPPAEVIRDVFGARWGFCTHEFQPIKQRLREDPRVTLRDAGGGFVFEIAEERAGR